MGLHVQLGTNVVGTLSTCLTRALLSTMISFIYHLVLFKRRKLNPPISHSMLFVFSKRHEGLNTTLILGMGGDTQGEGIGMPTVQKRSHFIEVSQHYNLIVPYL